VDDHFTLATGAAVRRWQRGMLGLPPARRAGEIPFGGVVFLPGPIRVTTVTATLGAPIEPGAPILAAISTRPVVTVALDPALQQLVHAGNRVQVLLPSRRTTSGTVIAVSRVAVMLDAGGG
jgi:hypothetical protein